MQLLSEDSGTRRIVGSGYSNPTNVIGTSFSTIIMPFSIDTTASWNSSTGVYTIPETGDYDINCTTGFLFNAGAGATSMVQLLAQRNESELVLRTSYGLPTTAPNAVSHYLSISGTISFKKGETLRFIELGQNVSATPSDTFISIAKRSSPQTIAASEKELVDAGSTSGQSLAVANSIVIFNNVATNLTASYNATTGIWTAPRSGKAKFNVRLFSANFTAGIANNVSIRVVGGAAKRRSSWVSIQSGSQAEARIDSEFYVTSGQQYAIYIDHACTGNLYATPTDTYMSISME